MPQCNFNKVTHLLQFNIQIRRFEKLQNFKKRNNILNKETNLSKTFACIINWKSKFALCHTFFRELSWFFVVFWGAKILKSEQDFKSIWKFPKHNVTNNFIRNFDVYFKEHNWIQKMSHPFKEPVAIFWYFVRKSTVKTKYNLKNNSKYHKNRLTNSFIKTLDMYFQ